MDINYQPTEQENKLYHALLSRGINVVQHYNDGHKKVDLAVIEAKIYIEIDGIQHFTNPAQIISDFKRSHYSDGDDFSTFYVTNQIIDTHLNEVADALVKVIEVKKI